MASGDDSTAIVGATRAPEEATAPATVGMLPVVHRAQRHQKKGNILTRAAAGAIATVGSYIPPSINKANAVWIVKRVAITITLSWAAVLVLFTAAVVIFLLSLSTVVGIHYYSVRDTPYSCRLPLALEHSLNTDVLSGGFGDSKQLGYDSNRGAVGEEALALVRAVADAERIRLRRKARHKKRTKEGEEGPELLEDAASSVAEAPLVESYLFDRLVKLERQSRHGNTRSDGNGPHPREPLIYVSELRGRVSVVPYGIRHQHHPFPDTVSGDPPTATEDVRAHMQVPSSFGHWLRHHFSSGGELYSRDMLFKPHEFAFNARGEYSISLVLRVPQTETNAKAGMVSAKIAIVAAGVVHKEEEPENGDFEEDDGLRDEVDEDLPAALRRKKTRPPSPNARRNVESLVVAQSTYSQALKFRSWFVQACIDLLLFLPIVLLGIDTREQTLRFPAIEKFSPPMSLQQHIRGINITISTSAFSMLGGVWQQYPAQTPGAAYYQTPPFQGDPNDEANWESWRRQHYYHYLQHQQQQFYLPGGGGAARHPRPITPPLEVYEAELHIDVVVSGLAHYFRHYPLTTYAILVFVFYIGYSVVGIVVGAFLAFQFYRLFMHARAGGADGFDAATGGHGGRGPGHHHTLMLPQQGDGGVVPGYHRATAISSGEVAVSRAGAAASQYGTTRSIGGGPISRNEAESPASGSSTSSQLTTSETTTTITQTPTPIPPAGAAHNSAVDVSTRREEVPLAARSHATATATPSAAQQQQQQPQQRQKPIPAILVPELSGTVRGERVQHHHHHHHHDEGLRQRRTNPTGKEHDGSSVLKALPIAPPKAGRSRLVPTGGTPVSSARGTADAASPKAAPGSYKAQQVGTGNGPPRVPPNTSNLQQKQQHRQKHFAAASSSSLDPSPLQLKRTLPLQAVTRPVTSGVPFVDSGSSGSSDEAKASAVSPHPELRAMEGKNLPKAGSREAHEDDLRCSATTATATLASVSSNSTKEYAESTDNDGDSNEQQRQQSPDARASSTESAERVAHRHYEATGSEVPVRVATVTKTEKEARTEWVGAKKDPGDYIPVQVQATGTRLGAGGAAQPDAVAVPPLHEDALLLPHAQHKRANSSSSSSSTAARTPTDNSSNSNALPCGVSPHVYGSSDSDKDNSSDHERAVALRVRSGLLGRPVLCLGETEGGGHSAQQTGRIHDTDEERREPN